MQLDFLQLLILLLQCCASVGVNGSHVPSLLILPQNPMFGKPGDTLVVVCSIGHIDAPDVKAVDPQLDWNVEQRKGKIVTRRLGGEDHVELTIHQLSAGDAGMYTCHSQLYDIWTQVLVVIVDRPRLPGNTSDLCMPTEFRCQSGHCIFKSFRCNKHRDCPFDDSDELYCDDLSCDDYPQDIWFQCSSGQCINRMLVCDPSRTLDCLDGSDEQSCPGRSTVSPFQVSEHHKGSWHFNAIYSAVAGVISLACIMAIIIITVCRIHMHHEALQHSSRVQHTVGSTHAPNSSPWSGTLSRLSWEQSAPPMYQSADSEQYLPQNCVTSASISFNINVHLSPTGMSEVSSLMLAPPPYSEVEDIPRDESPPPPYSTLDRNTGLQASRHNKRSREGQSFRLLPSEPDNTSVAHV